ncbi:MAG: HAD family phosphatase [Pelolinea sp.]|nr:HAD family phosphatase [Pelolinea sp.]
MTIKAIILDLEGVLLRTKDENLYITVANALNAPLEKVIEIFFGELNDQMDLGVGTQGEFDAYVVETLQMPKEKIKILKKVIDEDSFIDEVLLARIKELHKDYQIGLLSNYSNDLRPKLEHEWKISDVFDEIVISCEVGVIKPDAAIFNLILDRLGVSAGEAVFVDDRMRNIEGAKKVGMRTVFYVSREQAMEELERILGERE